LAFSLMVVDLVKLSRSHSLSQRELIALLSACALVIGLLTQIFNNNEIEVYLLMIYAAVASAFQSCHNPKVTCLERH